MGITTTITHDFENIDQPCKLVLRKTFQETEHWNEKITDVFWGILRGTSNWRQLIILKSKPL